MANYCTENAHTDVKAALPVKWTFLEFYSPLCRLSNWSKWSPGRQWALGKSWPGMTQNSYFHSQKAPICTTN